tara:strand:+ start:892 stop:1137 length:246 start_codon:yes stop_codon:yes gene_type:complete
MDEQQLLKIIADLKKTIEDQGLITRRTIIKNSRKNDVNSLKKQLSKFIDNDKKERRIRKKYPAVDNAYKEYKLLLKMAEKD